MKNTGNVYYCYADGTCQWGGTFDNDKYYTTRGNTLIEGKHGEIIARWKVKSKINA